MKLSFPLRFLILLLALVLSAANSGAAVLGATTIVIGPGGGNNSVLLRATSAWTASANPVWLHLNAGSQSGSGSTNVIFSADANSGGTRTGTLGIAGQTLTVTQAGAGYIAAASNTPLITTGLANPGGIAADGLGNLYIADTGNNAVKKWVVASNSMITLVGAGLSGPSGVAVDQAGNIFIADTGNNAIKEWVVANGTVTNLVSTGLNTPYGVAVDVSGNVFIADTLNNAIKKWTAGSGSVTTLVGTNLNTPYGVAVDGTGNVYIADTFNNVVKECGPDGNGMRTLAGNGLALPLNVAVDGSGNVAIVDFSDSELLAWTAASGVLITKVATGLSSPQGVAVDSSGNIYVADTGDSVITELPQAWVNPVAPTEGTAAGQDFLPIVLPATVSLSGVFAPVSDASWLTIIGITNSIVTYAFTASSVSVRTAHLSLLGQSIAITQSEPATTTTLAVLTPVTYGSNIVFQATVSPVPGAGTVQFYTNGVSLGNPAALSGGSASFSTSTLSAGNYSITATFNGVPGFVTSVSAAQLQIVVPAMATITGGVSANNKSYDGTTAASISLGSVTLGGVLVGDVNSLSFLTNGYLAAFASPSVSNNVTVLVSGLTLTGSAAGNYTVTQPLLTANIVPANPSIVTAPVASAISYGQTLANSTLSWGVGSVPGTFAFVSPSIVPGKGVSAQNVAFSPVDSVNYKPVTFTVSVTALTSGAVLGRTNLVVGAGSGVDSVVLSAPASWLAGANASWLHINTDNQNGTGSTNVVFSVDASSGATRTGTLTIAGQTLTVTQAGTGYLPANPYTPLVTGLGNPASVAVDGAGNIYIADTGNNFVKEWLAASQTLTNLVTTGLNTPSGVAVDGAGNVYIADTGNNAIKEWVPASGAITTLVATDLNAPSGVAVDSFGNVYIADTGNNVIKKWAPGGTVTTLVGSGLNSPCGVTVDMAGNVYIADTFNNAVEEWSAGRGLSTLIGSGLTFPTAVAVDGSGNVYVTDYLGAGLLAWTAATSSLDVLTPAALNSPLGVAVDDAGNVYVADTGDSELAEVPRAFINSTSLAEGSGAGAGVLPVILPATVNLSGLFAPLSDADWLTITSVTNGVMSYAFTASSTSVRVAHFNVLGQSITLTQGSATTTTLGTLAASAYGDQLIFSATIVPAPGAGTVQFYTNGMAFGDPAAVNGGGASLAAITLGAGNYVVTAAFGGAPGYTGSVSSGVLQTVAPVTVTITSGVTADNKPYDGNPNTSISINQVILSGVLDFDTSGVFLSTNGYTATFSQSGAGTGVIVTVSGLTLTGYAAGNYILIQPLLTASVTPATLVIAPGSFGSSENPSGFKDIVSFTTYLAPAATGNVLFLTNGGSFTTMTITNGQALSLPTTLLPVGTNVITVQYAGDANYLGLTNTLLQIVTNYLPVAQPMTVSATVGLAVNIAFSDLATNWTDPQGYPLELTAINFISTNGAPVALLNLQVNADGSYLITNTSFFSYISPTNQNDQISYTISDGQGGTATGLINLVASPSVPAGPNSIVNPAGNEIVVNFAGTPGFSYGVQRSTNLVSWLTIWITNAPFSGIFSYTDSFSDLGGNPPNAAYYRLGWNLP